MIANQGDILFADFGANAPPGHEQAGPRPCVVVGVPSTLQATRFPMLMVAPMTTADLPGGPLYPKLVPGTGGLTREGTVLLDQVRALGCRGPTSLLARGSAVYQDHGFVEIQCPHRQGQPLAPSLPPAVLANKNGAHSRSACPQVLQLQPSPQWRTRSSEPYHARSQDRS